MTAPLDSFRTGGRHWLAVLVAAALGLALATVHPVGFAVGGALVGVLAYNLKRALMAGLGFGLLSLAVFGAVLFANGALDPALATGQMVYVTAAIPLAASVLGSLARGLV